MNRERFGLHLLEMPLFPGWNVLLRRLRETSPDRKSQAEVAKAIGVTGKTISAYERGDIEPQISRFSEMLELYGIRNLVQLQREIDRATGKDPEPATTPQELRRFLPGASPAELRMHADLIERMEELKAEIEAMKGKH